MRMKDDYMRNGQLKPGYNLQIATENQYVLADDLFPDPTDTKTLNPFLDSFLEQHNELPEYIVADDGYGYGSEENQESIKYMEKKRYTEEKTSLILKVNIKTRLVFLALYFLILVFLPISFLFHKKDTLKSCRIKVAEPILRRNQDILY